ncbi:MAG: hypothetical protein RIQ93_805 [Verrucomicrobiota bacterium]|jgi:multiple sugar transport system ATP-binding protein
MARVVLEKLVKTYSDHPAHGPRAVDEINLSIREREFMVLVGPSGCGKSTTLRMIAGLETISSGEIRIDDRVVNEVPPKDRDIAMVFQNYALYPHMTVFENMAFGLKQRNFPRDEIEKRVKEAAVMLGLEALLDRRPKTLSGGQRQRVAVGRAIVRKPKVFLFDEPLSNLDAKMRLSTRAEISKLHERLGATMIYVTHDQAEAMTMGDRICVMNGGKILQVAEPLELYHQPVNLFVAGFIGSPPMNFFRGSIQQHDTGAAFVEDNRVRPPLVLPLPAQFNGGSLRDGKPVVLGVRPEDIHVLPGATSVVAPLGGQFTVEIVEPLGAETLLYLGTGATSFVARLRGTDQFRTGADLKLGVDLQRAHFFDPASELRMTGES